MDARPGPYEVTIWVVVEGDKVYLGTANVNRQWVGNVQKTSQIRLSIGKETFEGTARFLTIASLINVPWQPFDGSIGCIGRSLRWDEF